MNAYATNRPAEGFEMAWSADSIADALRHAKERGYAHVWVDEMDDETCKYVDPMPAWVERQAA